MLSDELSYDITNLLMHFVFNNFKSWEKVTDFDNLKFKF